MTPARWLLACLGPTLVACVSATTPDDGARRHVDALEEEGVALRVEREALERRFDAVFSTVCTVAIDGVVLDVDPGLGRVVLDKGLQDGVEVGHVFDVFLGARFKGLVRITEVREGLSVGTVLATQSPIERGDSASTCLQRSR